MRLFKRDSTPPLNAIETIAKNRALALADAVEQLAAELVERAKELQSELKQSHEGLDGRT